MIKIGLIGAGRMGRVYAHTLSQMRAEVVLAGVADQNVTLAQQIAVEFGIPEPMQIIKKSSPTHRLMP